MASLRTPSPELVRLVRNALTHLYDTAYLENHPLTVILDAAGRLDHVTRAQRLRRLLLECIEALRPQAADGVGPEASRAHAILTYRYIDGMTMEEIAARRALSERQAYRELERGLEAVAALLQERIGNLEPALAGGTPMEMPFPDDPLQVARVEVARLRETVRAESLDPGEILQGVLSMLEPIEEQIGVRFSVQTPATWPSIVADRVMLRQAVLNLLTYAAHLLAPGDLSVRAATTEGVLQITVDGRSSQPKGARALRPVGETDRVRLLVARALVEAQGGRLETDQASDYWTARLSFRIAARTTILVVDDNQDLIALFRRYVAGHDITVVGASESAQALRLAAELQPGLITIDVMMPGLDGWEILQQIKATPTISHIPVIVCSVLHEPELARSMGASDYLVKPVQQADFLAVLDRHLLRAAPVS
ncbi:MAG TPA: response regulator [Chloroflexota bacterium]|nr:response regulator [Chloroflexota bacterium]